jgi:hypothetical protein
MDTGFAAVVRDGGRPQGSSHLLHSEFTHLSTFGVDDTFAG